MHGYTWRKLLPELAQSYTCYVIDLPGLGNSQWSKKTDFNFSAQAERLSQFCRDRIQTPYTLIAHDTGATIARLVALSDPELVKHLILFNTEIPNHRPPWIQFYQLMAKLPGSLFGFKLCLSSRLFLCSNMGLKEFYSDKSMLREANNIDPYIAPLLQSKDRLYGAISYLKGIDWEIVDSMAFKHKEIKAKTLFLWGEDDKTFPVIRGKEMINQFENDVKFVGIENASLLPHEEQPELVIEYIKDFLIQSF